MENLELYERLQILFNKNQLQIGDRIYDYDEGKVGFVSAIDEDRFDYINENGHDYWLSTSDDFLRLPLPIDPVSPERGLWGMVDWIRFGVDIDSFGLMNIFDSKDDNVSVTDGWRNPTEALLHALCEQEGV